jgi:hypothetical protein
MSMHALCTPLGALLGPIMWLGIERFTGEYAFSVAYVSAALMALVMACIAHFDLRDVSIDAPRASHAAGNVSTDVDAHDRVVHVTMDDGNVFDVHVESYRWHIFTFFCAIMTLVNLSMGLYMINFQPIMVYFYHADGQTLGICFMIISVLAIVPPLLVAYLSKYLKDRHIMLIGMFAKLVGITFFLPIFGRPVARWQVVAGFVLCIKASVFFFTAAMSLFTKLLGGGMLSGAWLGVLSSLSALGPAIAQLLFAHLALESFGGWTYGVYGVPAVLALCMVAFPWYWKRLDSDREFTRRLVEGYAAL